MGLVQALRPQEEWARRVISAAARMPVVQHDDGSRPGMHDLDIVYPSGRAAVEVVADADAAAIQLWKLINPVGQRWIEPRLRGGWAVEVQRTARAKALRTGLPALLAALESEGATALDCCDDVELERAAHELGVVTARQGGTDYRGSIYPTIYEAFRGGAVPAVGDPLAAWVADFLSRPAQKDVLRKLASSGRSERHAFVIVAPFTSAGFEVVDLLIRRDPPLATSPPRLPAEVTAVWVASTWSSGTGHRWTGERGWELFNTADPGE